MTGTVVSKGAHHTPLPRNLTETPPTTARLGKKRPGSTGQLLTPQLQVSLPLRLETPE